MLILAGTFIVDPAQRDAFIASRLDTMRNSRSEPGCHEYTFSADPIDPTRVILLERWDDQASLDAHLAALATPAPVDPNAGEPPPPINPTSVSIIVYEVASERTLV
ncbi:MAG TPA: putative quinol monooxygenase [Acidimicrobiales bacterium]